MRDFWRITFRQLICICAVSLAVLASANSAFAFENPLRDPSLLNNPMIQEAMRVSTARVLYVDYALVRRDFPETRMLSNAKIDQLILDHCAAIAVSQTRKNNVNTEIQLSGESVSAIRPRGYGRALIFRFLDGLMDGKGAGALSPAQKDHGNGLASLTEAFRELLMEKLVNSVARNEGYKPGTVESYAVVDYGFDIVNDDATTARAGLVLRQAHLRGTAVGRLATDVAQRIEGWLRKYGIISDSQALSYEYQTGDRQNVQAAVEGNLFDFGGYRVLAEGKTLNGSPVQADEAIRVPPRHWAIDGRALDIHPETDQLNINIEKITKAWTEGRISRERVDSYVQKMLEPARHKFTGRSCSMEFEI